MNNAEEKAVIDALIISMFESGQVESWCCAQDITDALGWDQTGFKSVVWSLTRLTSSGALEGRIVDYAVPYRRGTGEQRTIYALPTVLPQWLMPQGLRGKG